MKNLIFYLFLFLLISADLHAEPLHIVTNEFPPFQVINGENVSGFTTEIVRHVLKGAGLKGGIKAYPWPRAYKMATKEPNTLIYSIVRTKEREHLFKWIGTVAPYDVYFWKLKKRKDIHIKNVEDAKKYLSGAMLNGSKGELLIKHGFIEGKNLDLGDSDLDNFRKLYAGRVDLILYDSVSFRYTALQEKKDAALAERIFKVEGISSELYLAASHETPDSVVAKLRTSLEAFKKTGKYAEIKSHLR
jgi:polar amino acid transport system substrate-binding protein